VILAPNIYIQIYLLNRDYRPDCREVAHLLFVKDEALATSRTSDFTTLTNELVTVNVLLGQNRRTTVWTWTQRVQAVSAHVVLYSVNTQHTDSQLN